MGAFKEAHGGTLKDLYGAQSAGVQDDLSDEVSWDLTPRQLCDVELLLNGAFSPLDGFLSPGDYDRVLAGMRLASGVLWPVPITLDLPREFADSLTVGQSVVLRDAEGVAVATLAVESLWEPDKSAEANALYGTDDARHPGVRYLLDTAHDVYAGGRLTGIEPPTHYDFKLLRCSPAEMRERFRKLGWRRVIAFHTDRPMHRAEHALTFRAAREHQANLLIHPTVGMAATGDPQHYARIHCYEHVLAQYPDQTTALGLVNLATRSAGPREAMWHAIVRKNFGCTHFIVEPSHASPPADGNGGYDDRALHAPEAAQLLCKQHEQELDISVVAVEDTAYDEDKAQYLPLSEIGCDVTHPLGESEFRRRLHEGLPLPEWYSFPAVLDELRQVHPPRHRQGFTVFFTGLSGSGKSTLANALLVKLLENGHRPVTLLDGDIVRKNLSSELGFSKEHRDLNVMRIGFVAGQITRHGGIAICAPIAPYAATRRAIRQIIEASGGFIEIHVATPIEVCERRDRKGLYAKARAGLIPHFTGIDDPYEVPEDPEMRIDTSEQSAELAAHRIIIKLESLGFVR